MIPWFVGGHCDPWNHVEAAMALSVCGRVDEAEAAYGWLAATQLGDGWWFNYYLGDRVKDARIDTNVCAYVATGRLAPLLRDRRRRLPARALRRWSSAPLDFVLRCQLADGTIRWSARRDGPPRGLRAAHRIVVDLPRAALRRRGRRGARRARPDWELAAGRLGHAVAHHPGRFAPKNEYAMDWYYPVLCGALEGARGGRAARRRDRDATCIEGLGVRCVSTNDWVTAAETAECAMALDALGRRDEALDACSPRPPRTAARTARTARASPTPARATFPGGETTSYTAAAIVLAADALSSTTGGGGAVPRRAAAHPRSTCPPGRCRGAASVTCTAA